MQPSLKAAFLTIATLAAAALAAPALSEPGKALVPVPASTAALMAARDMDASAPILIRSYKKESELEVWKMTRGGRYALLKTFPICRWSGQLGPKRQVGDRMSPEGFYSVGRGQMNPNSAYHLSFDLGYPNAYDRAHGGTGSALMVHGICSSMGCYAMTNDQISEVFALARDALAAGQRAFQVQAYPFRMTALNMARARSETHIDFWRQLKDGADRFEATGEELTVGVSASGRYAFAASRNPAKEAAAQARMADEAKKTAALVEDGAASVRITYADGGMHPTFASLRSGRDLGPVSRPEALALAGKEIVLIPARKKPMGTALAALYAKPVSIGLGSKADGMKALFAPVSLLPASVVSPAGTVPATAMAGSAAPMVPAGLQKIESERVGLFKS